MENPSKFPYEHAKKRLARYQTNDLLFQGEHKLAFNKQINDPRYNRDYAKLRYIVANFAGLISKVCADFQFGEPVKAKWETDEAKRFGEALFFENQLHTQFYESSLLNSRRGDALLKIRTGNLRPGDKDLSLIVEDINPAIYFPQVDENNVRAKPHTEELCWVVNRSGKKYLRKEIHTPGQIENQLFYYEGEELKGPAPFADVGLEVPPIQQTGINRSLLVHIPNWSDGTQFWGYDDYSDLMTLFYALNNRFTKTDNILDTHADPILALPEGVLDDGGKVRREALKMVEIPATATQGTQQKPEYITWNAQLDAVWQEVDRLERLLYMFSETSPDAFGMGKGQSDSGRALKLRLMRTIAKVNRKRLYYDAAIKEALFVAQEFGRAQSVGVMGVKAPAKSELVELEWSDGIPQDYVEQVETETKRYDAGLSSAESAIQRLDGTDAEGAQEELKKRDDEDRITAPSGAPNPPNLLNSGGTEDKGKPAGQGTPQGNQDKRRLETAGA